MASGAWSSWIHNPALRVRPRSVRHDHHTIEKVMLSWGSSWATRNCWLSPQPSGDFGESWLRSRFTVVPTGLGRHRILENSLNAISVQVGTSSGKEGRATAGRRREPFRRQAAPMSLASRCLLLLPLLLLACEDSTNGLGGDLTSDAALPSCTGAAPGTWISQADLPSGPCSGPDSACQATVVDTCPDGSQGQMRGNQCSCSNGLWACEVAWTSKGACKPPSADGGIADAG